MATQPAPLLLSAADPWNNPTAWDVIQFGGVTSPGICEVGEFNREYEFDTKKGKGAAGAVSTLTGLPPAKGKVKFWLWMASHATQWDAFVAILKQYPTKQAVNAATIYHPGLAFIDVNQVTVTKIGSPVKEGGGPFLSITVDFLEYAPPPAVSITSTPITAVQEADPNVNAPDPNAAQEANVAALLAEFQQP
jgi:hypothetical protein